MNEIIQVVLFTIVVGLILYFRPDIDRTREGDVLLWYGIKNRKYVKLFKL